MTCYCLQLLISKSVKKLSIALAYVKTQHIFRLKKVLKNPATFQPIGSHKTTNLWKGLPFRKQSFPIREKVGEHFLFVIQKPSPK